MTLTRLVKKFSDVYPRLACSLGVFATIVLFHWVRFGNDAYPVQDHHAGHIAISLEDRLKPETVKRMQAIRKDITFQMECELRDILSCYYFDLEFLYDILLTVKWPR